MGPRPGEQVSYKIETAVKPSEKDVFGQAPVMNCHVTFEFAVANIMTLSGCNRALLHQILHERMGSVEHLKSRLWRPEAIVAKLAVNLDYCRHTSPVIGHRPHK